MIRLFFSLFLFLTCVLCHGQNDQITNHGDLSTDNGSIMVYNLSLSNKMMKKVLVKEDNKYKKMPKDLWGLFTGTMRWEYECKLNIKNKEYLQFKSPIVPTSFYVSYDVFDNLCPNMRSISYWEQLVKKTVSLYRYEYDKNGVDAIRRYHKIKWFLYPLMPDQIDGLVRFSYVSDGNEKVTTDLSNKDNLFRSEEEYKGIVKEYCDSLRQYLENSDVDYHFFTASLRTDLQNIAGMDSARNKDDLVFPFYYNSTDNTYKCYVNRKVIELRASYINFLDSDLEKILITRKQNGVSRRDSLARLADSLYSNHKLDSLKHLLGGLIYAENLKDSHYQKYINNVKAKKLFLEDYEYSSDYSNCGLKFRIFNCFNKTIKYIQFTATPYNAVGDVQPDWMGKKSATTKGIGPLEPGYSASWDFDNMFYDHNDIIDRIRPTAIKFIFMDGSTQVFSGYSNINSHRFYDYESIDLDADDVIKICNDNMEPFVLPEISIPANVHKLTAEKVSYLTRIANENFYIGPDDRNAQFPGGENACYDFLRSKIQYPAIAQEQGIQGRVFVSFIVDVDGSLEDIRVVRSPDSSLSEEALRVVRLMPKWEPAILFGEPIKSTFNLPVMFRLN